MAQTQNTDNSGMGVVLGVLLAVVVAIGAYFFLQNRNVDAALEPAAGIETNINVTPSDNAADPAPEPTPAPAPAP